MRHTVQLHLLPLGKRVALPPGSTVRDALFANGVEFPCGGRGLCKGCKVKVVEGHASISEEDRQRLSEADLMAGWRLACRIAAEKDLTLEVEQWETTILSDDSKFEFTPAQGLGVAVDLGTTTIVAQLIDLESGVVLGVRTALNEQAKHGADIMTRVEFACHRDGLQNLKETIRRQVEQLLTELLRNAGQNKPLARVVLVGNTVMHHLFCGIDVTPLSSYPFEPVAAGLQTFTENDLSWDCAGDETQIQFLPCLGGFVGSDILAGIAGTAMHKSEELAALIDLGTNGEIVVGNRDKLLCASTAAGPAFEGARISMGMRAATGAISEVRVNGDAVECHVIGNGPPRGICGSGLVDAAAAGLELGWINPRGRITTGDTLPLRPPVVLTQWDIRELQLAKGAISAGLIVLLENWGASLHELRRVYLAGAFGNYVKQSSARRIGLLSMPVEKVQPSGNTALLGAKMALFGADEHDAVHLNILVRTAHVPLKQDPRFQEVYVSEMGFPVP